MAKRQRLENVRPCFNIDGSGNFYLADLDGQVVYQFSSDFTLTPNQPFLSQGGGTMPDQPEFILWVDDAWVTSTA